MFKNKLNNKTETGLNTHSNMEMMVSHSQNPVDNKILSVNDFKICIISNFFCSFPDKIL